MVICHFRMSRRPDRRLEIYPHYNAVETIYETDQQGNRVMVRSIHNTEPVYVRYTNTTRRTVKVFWRGYDGSKRCYSIIPPQGFVDVNTFLTHPWQFEDFTSAENFVVNNSTIFRPPKPTIELPIETRINWNITVPLRSLRTSAMIEVALLVRNYEGINRLEIPRSLSDEVKTIFVRWRSIDTPMRPNVLLAIAEAQNQP